MSTTSVAERTASAVNGLSASFMLDAATYAVGADAGFDGMDFYAAGRAGVLGDVTSEQVTACLVFFSADVVSSAWESSRDVMSRWAAAELFAGCLVTWADEHLGDDVDWARLAELADRIASGASISGAPVFAGWRALPVPEDPKAAALHQMNALRELRGARHGAAVIAVGLDVGDAVRLRSPMAAIFGWEGEAGRDAAGLWDEAEALTNRSTDRDYAALDADEAEEFVALCGVALAAVR